EWLGSCCGVFAQVVMALLRHLKLVLFGEILNSKGDVYHVVKLAVPDTTVQCSSDHIHERAFHMLEKDKSADKQERDNDGADRHHAEVGNLFTKQCPAKPLDDSGHRVQAIEKPPIFRHKADGVRNWGGIHPALS